MNELVVHLNGTGSSHRRHQKQRSAVGRPQGLFPMLVPTRALCLLCAFLSLATSLRTALFRPHATLRMTADAAGSEVVPVPASASISLMEKNRIELWKEVSKMEKKAVELLTEGSDASVAAAVKLLADSVNLKRQDPFIALAENYGPVLAENGTSPLSMDQMVAEMKAAGVPPHLTSLAKQLSLSPSLLSSSSSLSTTDANGAWVLEEVDLSKTFSDTVTEKIRVKVNAFYDDDKSNPTDGKFMFWYKVSIHNEGIEPVQVVARAWDIEKMNGEKETVKGAGIMSSQPIIPAGEVFNYQSVCPLKFEHVPKGKRFLGAMSGAYTMAKGNMGQHSFMVKVGRFELIMPEKDALDFHNGVVRQK